MKSKLQRAKRNLKKLWDTKLRPIVEPAFFGFLKKKAEKETAEWDDWNKPHNS